MLTVKNTSERESVKLRRLFFLRTKSKKDKKKISTQKEKYKFYVLKMTWDQALDAIKSLEEYLNSNSYKLINIIEIKKFNPNEDANEFIRCYNRAFITAPDPYRSLTLQDVRYFKPESTFVAILHGRIVGFIFLVIEPLIKKGKTLGKQGIIAGIGVDPRYRRKKIAFLLAARAAKYFTEKDILELVCEVYHANKVSYSFIQNFGFINTGTVYF